MAVATTSRALDLFLATEHVVGQIKARQQMAVLLERQWQVADGVLPKSGGALLGGRSGSGKTMLARAMCEASGLPFAEVNATRYTESGYAGLSLQQIFLPLVEEAAARYDAAHPSEEEGVEAKPSVLHRAPEELEEILAIASTGVILLDEFDKWMLRINHVTGQRDTAVQSELLKMIEGSKEYLSDNEDEVGVLFDTSKVLILCAGAFVSLQRIVEQRLDKVGADDEGIWDHITQEDCVKFGLLPELAGRLGTHIWLKPLRIEHLSAILTAPEGLLDEYRRRFETVGCEWAVSDAGVRSLCSEAIRRETGARAIDHVCWTVFGEALFKASTSEGPCAVYYEPMQAKATVR